MSLYVFFVTGAMTQIMQNITKEIGLETNIMGNRLLLNSVQLPTWQNTMYAVDKGCLT